jgi:ubiquinone/menaquinone biosynthesis C-methylase UbiE
MKRLLSQFDFIKKNEFLTLLRWLRPQKSDFILDVGCGIGKYDYFVAKKCKYLVGIDINAKAISKAKMFLSDQENCNFLVCDAHCLPFSDDSFDKILSLCSVEHFENDNQALLEMNRVLKQNGMITLSVDSLSNCGISKEYRDQHKKIYKVKNYYTLDTLEKKLEASYFTLNEAKYLITTKISLFFTKLGLRIEPDITNPMYILLFFLAYPLIKISEFFGDNKKDGFFIALKAKKY